MDRVRNIFLALAVLLASAPELYSKYGPEPVRNGAAEVTLFEENGKVGLKDNEGDVLIPAEYEAIGWSNGKLSIIDRVVGYRSNGLWGLISTSNRIVTAPEYLDLKPGEGSFLVAQKKSTLSQRPSFGIINTSGKPVIPCMYDALRLSNMRVIVMSRSGTRYLFGLADLSHKILIPLQYQQIYSLGSLRYAVENFEDKTAIFSDEGSQVTAFDIDSISSFKKDYAIVYQDHKQGIIDRNGRLILRPTYGEVRVNDDGAIQVREPHQWFLLRGDNTLITQHRADGLVPLSGNHYAVYAAGKLQLTGNDFSPVHAGYFSSLGKFERGMAIFRRGSREGVISREGKILIQPLYQSLEIANNGFRACLDSREKNRWVLLDLNGNLLSEKQYEYIAPYNGKYYPVKSRGYWGAVDAGGNQVITCVHDSILQESHDNVVVKFKGEYGVMNLREHWVVTPQPNPLQLLDDSAYLESADTTTFLRSMTGSLIYFSNNPLIYDGTYIREQLPSGGYWTIDMSGVVIDRSSQPGQADRVFPESEGLRAIKKDGKFGFIDDKGRLRIANRYEAVQPFSNGRAAIRIRDRWGFIDRHEKLVVQPVYDRVKNFDNDMAIVEQDGLSGLIDDSGRVILPLRYDEIFPNQYGRYIIRAGKLFGMADAFGSVIIHPKYEEIIDVGNGFVIAQRDGKSGVLTLRGVSTVPMIYDGLSFDAYHEQFVALKRSTWQAFKKE